MTSRHHGLFAALLALAALAGCGRAARPNVLFVVVDTLRRDYLGFYGRPDGLTPHLDALARSGQVFERHVAHASQTVPSVLSLMLSRLPAEHGFQLERVDQFTKQRPHYPESFLFLAEIFQLSGYATAGFVGNPYLGGGSGFGQGFVDFAAFRGDDRRITDAAENWLEGWSRKRPFFLYVHYMGVHQPYDPPEPFRSRFAHGAWRKALAGNRPVRSETEEDLAYARAVYAACVAAVDDEIGSLLRALDRLELRDDTLVVFTSDHGEEFGEHAGVGHGTSVYGELVRVPLVLSWPRELEPGRRAAHLSRHLDVAPTVLRLAGIAPPAEFRGTSLFEPAPVAPLDTGKWRGVYADGWKLVWNRERGETRLFAADDALDARPVEDPDRERALRRHLDAYLALERPPAEAGRHPAPGWTAEEEAQLRSLGYAE